VTKGIIRGLFGNMKWFSIISLFIFN
jgi:hypothetical protein